MIYQRRKEGTTEDWADMAPGAFPACMLIGHEYRVKPEPAAPKWPQTTVTVVELGDWFQSTRLNRPQIEVIIDGVNKAIAKECHSGALVPADKVREIEAKAREEGAKAVKLDTIDVIQATYAHMRLGNVNADDLQIILLKAAK